MPARGWRLGSELARAAYDAAHDGTSRPEANLEKVLVPGSRTTTWTFPYWSLP